MFESNQVGTYGQFNDDLNRPTMPVLRCQDCAKNLDWVRGAYSVLLVDGELRVAGTTGTAGRMPVSVCAGCGNDLTPATPDQQTDLDLFTAWLQGPDTTAGYLNEPPDGSLILVDESAVYVRTDTRHATERAKGLEPGAWVGDWWPLDGSTDGISSWSLGEILNLTSAVDDKVRGSRTFEVLFTAADVARLAGTFTAQQAAKAAMRAGGS